MKMQPRHANITNSTTHTSHLKSAILNALHAAPCAEFMRENIADASIDLTLTSPPYDDLRNYNGYAFDLKNSKRASKSGFYALASH